MLFDSTDCLQNQILYFFANINICKIHVFSLEIIYKIKKSETYYILGV